MLGARVRRHTEDETTFGLGDTLLRYTDGLIEDLTSIWQTLVPTPPGQTADNAAFVAVRAHEALP